MGKGENEAKIRKLRSSLKEAETKEASLSKRISDLEQSKENDAKKIKQVLLFLLSPLLPSVPCQIMDEHIPIF